MSFRELGKRGCYRILDISLHEFHEPDKGMLYKRKKDALAIAKKLQKEKGHTYMVVRDVILVSFD